MWAATAALLAASAIVISLLRLRLPYPLLPFLSFDLAEIPSVLALLILDLKAGVLVALAHWLTLNLGKPYHALIGPSMKLLAVLSMLLGFRLAWRSGNPSKGRLSLILGVGALTRVGVMAAVTFALYYLLFPQLYLSFASKIVGKVFGWEVESALALTLLIVGLTALFNLLHVPLSLIPATIIHKAYKRIRGEV